MCVTRGIIKAETGGCKTGSAVTHKNCGGIMEWSTGTRKMRVFNSHQESIDAVYSLIKRKYQDYTIKEASLRYTGNDRSENWERIVKATYKECI